MRIDPRSKTRYALLHIRLKDYGSEDKIIRIYGKRWDIEVFFKACKSMLRLTSECRSLSYDAMTAHTAIVFAQYMLLSVEAREQSDPRTMGPLFCLVSEELADISFADTAARLQQLFISFAKELLLSDETIAALMTDFMAALPKSLAETLGFKPNCAFFAVKRCAKFE